jgi:regulator of protease activity HflC (stomatin/prohibitin superfamily)
MPQKWSAMTAQESPPLEDGLVDKVEHLPLLYLLYVVTPLLLVLVPLTVLFLLLQPPWPLTVIIALPLAITTLILLILVALQGPGWLAALGLVLVGLVWGITILEVLPSALAGGIILSGAVLLLLILMAILLRNLRALLILILLLLVLIANFLVLEEMLLRRLPLNTGMLIYGSEALFLTFLIGSLFFLGGRVLPFPPPDPSVSKDGLRSRLQNHWTAAKILLGYALGMRYPFWVVTREPREEDKIEERGKGDALAMLAIGRGIIISDCDHAVAVSDGIKFKGAQGPGLSFTGFADRPMRTLDLRPQLRAFTVQGLTRDGIQVKVLAFTPFQIDRGEQQPRLGAPFPYRKSAAFRAVHAQMMAVTGEPDHPQHAWDELPQLCGTRILQDILARYDFDDLYRYDPGEEPPRVRIAREFRKRLRAELEPFGIQLIGGGISNLLPIREEVLKERVRNWRAEWVRRILVQQAEGQRERLWRIEQARAEAQAQLILALGEQLAELDRPDTPVTPQKIVDQFLKILEEMTQQPMMRRYLPREIPEDLRRLGAEAGGKEASS